MKISKIVSVPSREFWGSNARSTLRMSISSICFRTLSRIFGGLTSTSKTNGVKGHEFPYPLEV